MAGGVFLGCENSTSTFDVQGHRGARGYLPENTIPSFLLAIEQGATTLELDLALTADTQLIISHEPWLSSEICLDTFGDEFNTNAASRYNLFKMNYADIQKFDCGSRSLPHFPEQKPRPASKPLLSDLLDTLTRLPAPIPINVEIKSRPSWDSLYYPTPAFIVDQLLLLLADYEYTTYTTIQSFDVRPLQYLQDQSNSIPLALLVSNAEDPVHKINLLKYPPDILSPHHTLVNEDLRQWTRDQQILLIPWTVNDPARMRTLIHLQVDGIITDYPDKLQAILAED